MGVRLTRFVNGDSGNRVFRAASGVQILQPPPLASLGDLRAVRRDDMGVARVLPTRPPVAARPRGLTPTTG